MAAFEIQKLAATVNPEIPHWPPFWILLRWRLGANAYWHTLWHLSLTSMQLRRNYRKGLLNET